MLNSEYDFIFKEDDNLRDVSDATAIWNIHIFTNSSSFWKGHRNLVLKWSVGETYLDA